MPYTWLQFKNEVKILLTDVELSNTTAVEAVADYVKFKVSREVNHDLALASSYYASYTGRRLKLLGFSITLNSSDLRTAVNKLITVDASRAPLSDAGGTIDEWITEAKTDIAGFATRIDRLIRQAVLDVQHHVPRYRKGHETVYDSTNFVTEGSASKGKIPEGADIKQAWLAKIVEDDACTRMELSRHPWAGRQSLICGEECINNCTPKIALDPHQMLFYVYPAVTEEYQVVLFWDGKKLTFADAESTPFDEMVIQAVAEYVKGKLAPTNEQPRYFNTPGGIYVTERRKLLRESLETSSALT